LRNGPGRRQTAGDFTGKYSRADRVSDQDVAADAREIIVWEIGFLLNMAGAGERLRSSGADEVVVSLAEAVVQLAKFSVSIADKMIPGAIPDNEESRLEELARLHLADGTREEVFDRITKKLARLFEVPIALITFIDRDRQWFKSQVGLPEEIAEAQQTSRELSVAMWSRTTNYSWSKTFHATEDLQTTPYF
jgi:hypothetical protein